MKFEVGALSNRDDNEIVGNNHEKKKIRHFIVFSIIFSLLLDFVVVYAEDNGKETIVNNQGMVSETVPEGCTQLILYLPSGLAGKTLDIKNALTGENIGNVIIDSTGSGTAIVPVQKSVSISLSGNSPSANQNKKSSGNISVSAVLFFAIPAIGLTAFVFFQIGKRKTLKKYDAALDFIYNEELDD